MRLMFAFFFHAFELNCTSSNFITPEAYDNFLSCDEALQLHITAFIFKRKSDKSEFEWWVEQLLCDVN